MRASRCAGAPSWSATASAADPRRAPRAATPLDDAAFAAALDPLAPGDHVAVAVSGGADSTALFILSDAWARARAARLTVLSVDHGLRPEAAAETAHVARLAEARGRDCEVLRAEVRPRGNLQAAARAERMALLVRAAIQAGASALLLGHTLEDQAETVLLRLARGSGVRGLAAMAPASAWGDVRVLRPLLAIPRARVAARARAEGASWIEDPSNAERRFDRVRLREAAAMLAALGLTPERLAATAAAMARAEAALEAASDDLARVSLTMARGGYGTLDVGSGLRAAPDEIGLRLLGRLVQTVSGAAYAPRLRALERLLARVGSEPELRATLGGVAVAPGARGRLVFARELRASAAPLALRPGEAALWDGRFKIAAAADDGPARAMALGQAVAETGRGWRRLLRPDDARALLAWPQVARATAPVLLRDGARARLPRFLTSDEAGAARGAELGDAACFNRFAFYLE